MSDIPGDLEFLLQAANYTGPSGSTFSKPARDAIDLAAEHSKALLEMKLKIARERLKLMDPAKLAAEDHELQRDLR